MEIFLRQLASRKPTEFRAHVVDVRSYGLSVELPDVLVSGLIHVSALPDDFYTFDSVRLRFIGQRTGVIYKVGDTLTVIVARVDAYKRQIDFVPVGSPRSETPSEQGSKGRGFAGRRDDAKPGISKRERSRKRR